MIFFGPVCSTLLSGVPKIIRNEITETTMDAMKIARQLMNCVIAPPNTAARPEPPHEPIDHIETARCRAGPSQYAFTSAIDAGMMHAAEKPWIARPASSNGKANPPTAKTSSREPHDAESYADQRDLDAADSVGEATRQDDEQPGKQGSNRDGEIHRSGVDEPRANVLHYRRSDSPRSAGEEPEGDDSEDEAEEELVSPLVARRWSSRSCACHGSLLLKERQGSHDGRLGTGLQRRLHDWAEER
jgi:hypothetical protein